MSEPLRVNLNGRQPSLGMVFEVVKRCVEQGNLRPRIQVTPRFFSLFTASLSAGGYGMKIETRGPWHLSYEDKSMGFELIAGEASAVIFGEGEP